MCAHLLGITRCCERGEYNWITGTTSSTTLYLFYYNIIMLVYNNIILYHAILLCTTTIVHTTMRMLWNAYFCMELLLLRSCFVLFLPSSCVVGWLLLYIIHCILVFCFFGSLSSSLVCIICLNHNNIIVIILPKYYYPSK